MGGISIRAYAKTRGCSEGAVRKAILARRITPNPDGSIDAERANREWQQNTGRSSHAARLDVETAQLTTMRAPAVGPQSGATPIDSGSAYLRARAANETYKARASKIEVGRLEGSVIDVATVVQEWSEIMGTVKGLLLAFPVRFSKRLAVETDHKQVRILLDREFRRLLEQAGAEIRSPERST